MNEEQCRKLMEEVAKISKGMEDIGIIKATIEETNMKLTSINDRLNIIEKENEELKTKLELMEEEKMELREKVANLEQHTRKNNAIIMGIPITKHENLRELIKEVGKMVNIKIADYDICATHRLGGNGGEAAIIVNFNNRDATNDLIRAVKRKKPNAREIGFEINRPIYCDEQLTRQNKEILAKVKELRKNKILEFVWSRDGSIFIRENAESKIFKITHIEQLEIESKLAPITTTARMNEDGNVTIKGVSQPEMKTAAQKREKKDLWMNAAQNQKIKEG